MKRKILLGIVAVLVLAVAAGYISSRPTEAEEGTYSPSSLALMLATSPTTDLSDHEYANAHNGNKKVLVVCTEERDMTMANGKKFSTGNHPVETMLPMIHLENAGFDVEIVTPTGKSAKLEMWAMPTEDEEVMAFYNAHKDEFESPGSLADFVSTEMSDSTDYAAIFFPGGHGAMLGLPDNNDVNQIINWAHNQELYTLAICHGPAALLAAKGSENDFIYKGYKIAAFPDAVDGQTPMIGYMPGHMPWKFGEELNNLGVTIINQEADNAVNIDRKLITGASPLAANDFGKLAANTLLKEFK